MLCVYVSVVSAAAVVTANTECENWGGTRTPHEGQPAGVAGGLAAPARHHHQAAGDGEEEDAQDDEEQHRHPLWGQMGGAAATVTTMDGLTPEDQAHGHRAWMERQGERKSICICISFGDELSSQSV